MALLVSLGESLLAFMKAREERLAVFIGALFPCHDVKRPVAYFGRRWHNQKPSIIRPSYVVVIECQRHSVLSDCFRPLNYLTCVCHDASPNKAVMSFLTRGYAKRRNMLLQRQRAMRC